MKNIFKYLSFILISCSVLFFSCTDEKDPALSSSPVAPSLTAPAGGSSFNMSIGTKDDVLSNFTYTPANFGFSTEVRYTLQMAVAGTNFANAVDVTSGTGTTLSPTQDAINAGACPLGLTSGSANDVDMRIRAIVLDANGNTVGDTVYSSPITISISPYDPPAPTDSWGIIGSAIAPYDWSVDIDMTWDPCDAVWTIRLDVLAGEFKFRLNNDWGTNYGDTGADGTLDNGGDNISIAAGNYTFVLNLNAGTYTVTQN